MINFEFMSYKWEFVTYKLAEGFIFSIGLLLGLVFLASLAFLLFQIWRPLAGWCDQYVKRGQQTSRFGYRPEKGRKVINFSHRR
jgi:hypothetical protein